MDVRLIVLLAGGAFLLWKAYKNGKLGWLGGLFEKAKEGASNVVSSTSAKKGTLTAKVESWEELKNDVEADGNKEASAKLDEVFPLLIKKG